MWGDALEPPLVHRQDEFGKVIMGRAPDVSDATILDK